MAVYTGTYTDRGGFLDALRSVAANLTDWTINDWDSTNQEYLSLQYDDPTHGHTLYWNFHQYSTTIYSNLSTGWDVAKRRHTYQTHPGAVSEDLGHADSYSYVNLFRVRDEGAVTGYTAITDGHYIAFIIEQTPGVFTHIFIGRGEGAGVKANYVFFSTAWDTSTNYASNAYDTNNDWLGGGSDTIEQLMFLDKGDGVLLGASTYASGPRRIKLGQATDIHKVNTYHRWNYVGLSGGMPSQRIYLHPLTIDVETIDGPPGYINRCGAVPNTFFTNCKDIEPGATVDFAGENYMVFPIRSKQANRDYDPAEGERDNSFLWAYAYKVV